jgi:hypothetical protein
MSSKNGHQILAIGKAVPFEIKHIHQGRRFVDNSYPHQPDEPHLISFYGLVGGAKKAGS